MAFTARTTATFGEVWTAVAANVRVTQVQFEVIVLSAAPARQSRTTFMFFNMTS
jgi:hypothetical protein